MEWLSSVARRNSKLQIQSSQRPRARAERFDFDAEPLEHIDVQIAQWRGGVDIEGEVLTVLKATTSQEDREVFGGVTAAIAKVAAEKDAGAIQ